MKRKASDLNGTAKLYRGKLECREIIGRLGTIEILDKGTERYIVPRDRNRSKVIACHPEPLYIYICVCIEGKGLTKLRANDFNTVAPHVFYPTFKEEEGKDWKLAEQKLHTVRNVLITRGKRRIFVPLEYLSVIQIDRC